MVKTVLIMVKTEILLHKLTNWPWSKLFWPCRWFRHKSFSNNYFFQFMKINSDRTVEGWIHLCIFTFRDTHWHENKGKFPHHVLDSSFWEKSIEWHAVIIQLKADEIFIFSQPYLESYGRPWHSSLFFCLFFSGYTRNKNYHSHSRYIITSCK